MPRPRFYKLSVEKQRKILDVAKREFADNGFEDASYNRIIEQAGLSKGAMYYYFDDKIDLYATVFREVQEELIGSFDLKLDITDSFWSQLEGLYQGAVQLAQDKPELVALIRGLTKLPSRLRQEGPIAEVYAVARKQTEAVIQQGQEAGVVRDDIPMSLLISVAMSMGEAIDMWFFEHFDEVEDLDRTIAQMVSLLKATFQKEPQ